MCPILSLSLSLLTMPSLVLRPLSLTPLMLLHFFYFSQYFLQFFFFFFSLCLCLSSLCVFPLYGLDIVSLCLLSMLSPRRLSLSAASLCFLHIASLSLSPSLYAFCTSPLSRLLSLSPFAVAVQVCIHDFHRGHQDACRAHGAAAFAADRGLLPVLLLQHRRERVRNPDDSTRRLTPRRTVPSKQGAS